MELNDKVTITLTREGAKVYNRQMRRINRSTGKEVARTTYREGEQITTRLWDVVDTFGGYCAPGGEPPFINLGKVE